MEKLRNEVLQEILLRRTKSERQADINLPPLTVHIRKDKLSDAEMDFYRSMYQQSLTQFDTYVDKGTLLHNFAHVFDLIMRLRQAVDHPYLIIHGSLRAADGSASAGQMPTRSRGDGDICALCQEDIEEDGARALCGHSFHRDCVTEYMQQAPELPTGGIGCPACYSPLTIGLEEDKEEGDAPVEPEAELPRRSRQGIMQRIKAAEFQSSTKIEALLQEIKAMESRDGRSKALVFSQFVNMLDLIEWRLKSEGVSCAKLIGSMSVISRNNMIISFSADATLKVLLISLKAGGEGLNLQAADHIFLMDPWWNPASELQAIQRAHRIGQTRPVKATRFVAEDTIEEKILGLQEKKQSVFDCTVGGSNTALQKLTAEDIKFLFNQ
jgi:DNA repair protein RAD16